MHFLKDYLEYLKDNPEHYWFKRKPFGWGWTPVTWQGWLVTLIFVGAVIINAFRLNIGTHLSTDSFSSPFIIETALMLLIFVLVCLKTGEKPRWEWGFPKKDDTDEQK